MILLKSDVVAAFDVLCPLHVLLDEHGVIHHTGATLTKLHPELEIQGTAFLDLFEVTRPVGISSLKQLRKRTGVKLHIRFKNFPNTALKGVFLPLGKGAMVNLSFGIFVHEAVSKYALASTDFAVTDSAIEMLYLVEAKSAAMDASKKLNERLQGARIAAEEQAFSDNLTGLGNRRALMAVFERLQDASKPFAVMHLDLDYFKFVNDNYGHAAGDFVLQQVAKILLEETRKSDTVVRSGGDEFVLVFENLTDQDKLEQIAKRIILRLEHPLIFQGEVCRVSASIGTSLSDAYDQPDFERMMADADHALYQSKKQGKAQHTFFPLLKNQGEANRVN